MKRALVRVLLLLIVTGVVSRLVIRWREEKEDHQVVLVADWLDARTLSARYALSSEQLMRLLSHTGVNALAIPQSTLEDYLPDHRSISSKSSARVLQDQLTHRGLHDLHLSENGGVYRLTGQGVNWARLKDTELGFDPELLYAAEKTGFRLVLRVDHDPWISQEDLFHEIQEVLTQTSQPAILFNSEIVPGGIDTAGRWTDVLSENQLVHLLFEFKPSKASRLLAARAPGQAYRAHTIPSNELKDLSPDQEHSRWTRAVRERSCRFLLVRMSPDDSFDSYLKRLETTRQWVEQQDFKLAWPKTRPAWRAPNFLARQLFATCALLIAILTPILALRYGLREKLWPSVLAISLITLAGASCMAVLADNSFTRLQIVPFRGVKLAFLMGWAGVFCYLFSWNDLTKFMTQTFRRIDAFILLGVLGVVGYFLIRSGNAGASWKVGWEQGFRDTLEQVFIARPRFKEFAIGYPFLLLGLHCRKELYGKFLMGVGMLGPISMINTFCHLHSPLYLAYWRSMNGIVLGSLFGYVLLYFSRCRPRS